MDWRALLHDRRFQIGAVGAAAVGGYVLLRRKQTTGSTSTSQPAASTVSGSTTGTGFPDTTGTDVASWLGTQSGQLATQQQQFLDTLSGSLAGTAQVPTQSVQLNEGTPVDAFLSQYGVTLDKLLQLNPGLNLQIKNANQYGYVGINGNNGPATGQVFNVGANGSEPVLIPKPSS